MNSDINLNEIVEAMINVKLREAVGVVNLSNEILQNDNSAIPLRKLFNLCFNRGKIPYTSAKVLSVKF